MSGGAGQIHDLGVYVTQATRLKGTETLRPRDVGSPELAKSFSGRTTARHAIARVRLETSNHGQIMPSWSVQSRCGHRAVVDTHPDGTGSWHPEQTNCRRCIDLLAHDAGTTIEYLSVRPAD